MKNYKFILQCSETVVDIAAVLATSLTVVVYAIGYMH